MRITYYARYYDDNHRANYPSYYNVFIYIHIVEFRFI